ncbi:MAG: hypothetical protein NTY19_05455 [Planctomycetota bacterium]|nr:hypothetical protein [Planctomycetota bacterium]
MKSQFRCLHQAMSKAVEGPPRTLEEAIGSLPPMGTLPLPETTWLLLALIEYRERQRFGRKLLRKHLPEAITPSRRLCKRDQPVETILPDLPEWEVILECGYGLAELVNRVTQEIITVGLHRANMESIIYVHKLDRYAKPPSPEELASRLLQLHPNFSCTIWCAIDELVEAGFLLGVDDDGSPYDPKLEPNAHLLTSSATALAPQILEFCKQWQAPPQRLWLAAAIGDWPLAHELAKADGDASLLAVVGQRAEEYRQFRLNMIRKRLGDSAPGADTLNAFHELGADDLPEMIRRALRASGEAAQGALEYLAQHPDPRWCQEMYRVLRRPPLHGPRAQAGLTIECARFLLRHGYQTDEVVKMVCRVDIMLDEVALLLLEFSPQQALPAIRRALRTPSEFSNETAAALAMIDRSWSRRELLDALEEEFREAEEALPLVVALAESLDPEARDVAEAWEQRSDPAMVETYRQRLQWEMNGIRDRVMPLRDRIPASAAK